MTVGPWEREEKMAIVQVVVLLSGGYSSLNCCEEDLSLVKV